MTGGPDGVTALAWNRHGGPLAGRALTSRLGENAVSDEVKQMTRAPWTAEQVASLNGFQASSRWHEFTCACGALLIAEPAGWVCGRPGEQGGPCGYTQDWAWPWMADWSWRGAPGFRAIATS